MGTWRRRALISAAFTGAALLTVAAVACGSGSSSSYGGSSSSPTAKAAAAPTSVAPAAADDQGGGGSGGGGYYGNSTPAAGGGAPSSTSLGVGGTSLGQVLVDSTKMTLYVFAKDTVNSGKSACSGACATSWPPATVTSVPPKPDGANGTLATITRDDGTAQLTYNGMPLYRFAADKAPGDTKGDGVGGVWSVAKP